MKPKKVCLKTAVHQKTTLSKTEVNVFLQAFTEALREALQQGLPVELAPLGTLQLVRSQERAGVTPSGERFMVPPNPRVVFKEGEVFHER